MKFIYLFFKKIRVEPTKEVIQFEIHFTAEDRAWFAIGFSDRGEITPADYCILWSDWHLKVHFQVIKVQINNKLHCYHIICDIYINNIYNKQFTITKIFFNIQRKSLAVTNKFKSIFNYDFFL